MRTRVRGRVHFLPPPTPELLQGDAPRLSPEQARQELGLDPSFEAGDLAYLDAAPARRFRSDAVAVLSQQAGIALVLADRLPLAVRESFLSLGIPVLTHPQLSQNLTPGDDVVADARSGTLEGVRRRFVLVAEPLPENLLRLLSARPGLAKYGLTKDSADPDVYEGWSKTAQTTSESPQGT